MTRLGVVAGMAAEARCLPRLGAGEDLHVMCSGGDAGRAAVCARQLLAEGASALLSFGIAGGIDPALKPGTVIVGDSVIGPDGTRRATERTWREALVAAGARAVTVAGSDRPVATVAAKRALFAATGAGVVDIESHGIARVADENGIPFMVLRAVADPAGRALPGAALAGLGPDGRMRAGAVLRGLWRSPWEVSALVAVALDARRALAALRRSAAEPGALLGCGAR